MALNNLVTSCNNLYRLLQTVVTNSCLTAASSLHTTVFQSNSNRTSVVRLGRQKYERSYPVLLVRPDGSTINIRYPEPRRILKLPVDITTLSEDERRIRMRRREPKKAAVPELETFEDDFKVDDYSKFWKK